MWVREPVFVATYETRQQAESVQSVAMSANPSPLKSATMRLENDPAPDEGAKMTYQDVDPTLKTSV